MRKVIQLKSRGYWIFLIIVVFKIEIFYIFFLGISNFEYKIKIQKVILLSVLLYLFYYLMYIFDEMFYFDYYFFCQYSVIVYI